MFLNYLFVYCFATNVKSIHICLDAAAAAVVFVPVYYLLFCRLCCVSGFSYYFICAWWLEPLFFALLWPCPVLFVSCAVYVQLSMASKYVIFHCNQEGMSPRQNRV